MEVKIVGAAGVGIGPILYVHLLMGGADGSIYALNRLLGLYFNRQRNAEGMLSLGIELMIEHHLRKLLAEQRKQLDAIKKATNYDSTRKLIELYDEHTPSGSPSPQRQIPVPSNPVTPVRQPAPVPGSAKGSPATKGTPRAPGHLVGVGGTPQGMSLLYSKLIVAPGTPQEMTSEHAAALHLQMQAIQPVLPTPEKKWYDRIVDGILGDDPCKFCLQMRVGLMG
jgi:hypothetical protein